MNIQTLSGVTPRIRNTPALPKNLYHITSEPCLELINKKGHMRTRKDSSGVDGIFFFDMPDFLHNWNNPDKNIAYELLKYLNNSLSNLILLKLNLTEEAIKKYGVFVRKTNTMLQRDFAKKPITSIFDAIKAPKGLQHVEYVATKPIPACSVQRIGTPVERNELYFKEADYIGQDFKSSRCSLVKDILNLMQKN